MWGFNFLFINCLRYDIENREIESREVLIFFRPLTADPLALLDQQTVLLRQFWSRASQEEELEFDGTPQLSSYAHKLCITPRFEAHSSKNTNSRSRSDATRSDRELELLLQKSIKFFLSSSTSVPESSSPCFIKKCML